MPKSVVDFFQSVEIEQKKGEFPFGALRSGDFPLQHLKKPAVVGQASQRITQCLAAQMILERPLFRDVNDNNFISDKNSTLVKDAAAAEPGFQDSAVFPLPFNFNRLDSDGVGSAPSQKHSLAEVEDDLGRTIRRQQLLFGFIAEHRHQRLVDV